jgi:predicted permease
MRTVWSRIRALFRRGSLDARLDDEIRAHLDALAADHERRGLSPAQARLAARRDFGAVEPMKETYRDRRSIPWLEDLGRDVRYATRVLRRSPGFTLAAVVMLALGIGANTAAFSLFNAMRFKTLPAGSPHELVTILPMTDHVWDGVGRDEFVALRASRRAFSDVAAYAHLYMADAGSAREVDVYAVSGNFFDLMQVKPVLGRFFLPAEDQVPGRDPVVVLSDEFWRVRFSGAPDVIGSSITLNDQPFVVIGIAPAALRAPSYGDAVAGAWIPWMMAGVATHAQATPFTMLGRLHRGATVADAQSELDVRASGFRIPGAPVRARRTFRVAEAVGRSLEIPRGEPIAMSVAPSLLLIGAIGLLTITCANLAGVLIARGLAREKEIASRRALGASESRIFRQLMTESLVLSVSSVIPGLIVAQGFVRVIGQFYGIESEGSAQFVDVRLDPLVLAYAIAIAMAVGIVIGTLPGLRSARASLQDRISTRHTALVSNGLLIGQVAVSLVLLVHGGLLIRTVDGVVTNPGFDIDRVAFIRMKQNVARLDSSRARRYFQNVTQRVSAFPGVESVAFAAYPPLNSWAVEEPFSSVGSITQVVPVRWNRVTPTFFSTLGIPLINGRAFNDSDVMPGRRVVIINEDLARRLSSPVGDTVVYHDKPYEIIGIVRYTNFAKSDGTGRFCASFPDLQPGNRMFVRVAGGAHRLLPALHRTIAAIDPSVPISEEMALADLVSDSFMPVKLAATAQAYAAGLGLLLSGAGLYGALAYGVWRRTKEIGLRMALGARLPDVVRVVSIGGLLSVAIGIVLGLGLAAASTRAIAGLLFGIPETDPLAFLSAPALMLAIGMVAIVVPIRRAIRINPVDALRAE